MNRRLKIVHGMISELAHQHTLICCLSEKMISGIILPILLLHFITLHFLACSGFEAFEVVWR
jgi:hypothetical protein